MNPRVKSVKPNEDFTLSIVFENSAIKRFDVKPLLSEGVFQKLQDFKIFQQVRNSYGTVEWPEEIDICPDTLFEDSVDEVP